MTHLLRSKYCVKHTKIDEPFQVSKHNTNLCLKPLEPWNNSNTHQSDARLISTLIQWKFCSENIKKKCNQPDGHRQIRCCWNKNWEITLIDRMKLNIINAHSAGNILLKIVSKCFDESYNECWAKNIWDQ